MFLQCQKYGPTNHVNALENWNTTKLLEYWRSSWRRGMILFVATTDWIVAEVSQSVENLFSIRLQWRKQEWRVWVVECVNEMDFVEMNKMKALLGHCGGLKFPNTLSSYIKANAMNKKYQIMSMMPRRLSNFQPFKWTDNNKNTTVDSRLSVEYVKPVNYVRISIWVLIKILKRNANTNLLKWRWRDRLGQALLSEWATAIPNKSKCRKHLSQLHSRRPYLHVLFNKRMNNICAEFLG